MITGAVYPEVAELLEADLAERVARRVTQLLRDVEFMRVEAQQATKAIVHLDGGRDNLLWAVPLELRHRGELARWLEHELERWIRAGEPYPWDPQLTKLFRDVYAMPVLEIGRPRIRAAWDLSAP